MNDLSDDDMFTGDNELGDVEFITEYAEKIALLDAEYDIVHKQASKMKAELDAWKEKLATFMNDKGVPGMKLPSGLNPTCTVKTKFYPATGCSKEAFFLWLHKEKLYPAVHHGSMNTLVRTHLELGNELPESIINAQERPSIRLNNKAAFVAARKDGTV